MLLPALNRTGYRFVRSTISPVVALFAALLFSAGGLSASAQTTTSFTSTGNVSSPVISITGSCSSTIPVSGCSTSSSTYGKGGYGSSTINVSTAGTVTGVEVTLNGVTSSGWAGSEPPPQSDSLGFASFYLIGPGGQKFELLGCTGDSLDGDDSGTSSSGLDQVTIDIKDSATGGAPVDLPWRHTGSTTIKPSSYWENGNAFCGGTPVPNNAAGLTLPQTDSSATLNGTFANGPTNGNWTLYIDNYDTYITETANDPIQLGSWTLTLTYNATVSAGTTTSLASSSNPATPGTVTYTATVSSSSTVDVGTVAFSSNGVTISGCGAAPVSNGTATCAPSLTQGLYTIGASYSGGTGFTSSSASNITELVEGPTTSGGTDTFCNTGSIALAEGGAGVLYPSIIKVTGFPGQTVSNVEVKLLDIQGKVTGSHLLVSPDGNHNLDFLDSAFNESDTTTGAWLDFYDTAGAYPNTNGTIGPPSNSSASPADYVASDENSLKTPFSSSDAHNIDSAVPQVPGTINFGYNNVNPSETFGPVTESFGSNFSGVMADGDWALYPYENYADSETISGGWCIALTVNTGVATTTSVTSTQNPQVTGQTVMLTATVTAGGNPVSSGGTVTFLENGVAPPGTVGGNNVVVVNGSGQATFTTAALPEGDSLFEVEYSGDTSDNASQTNFTQRANNNTTLYGNGATISHGPTCGSTFCYCNGGAISTVASYKGAFTPNPSIISVPSLPGTVSSVTLGLNQYSSASTVLYALESMVVSPTGADLDYFSNAGYSSGGGTASLGNYLFSDSASSTISSSVSTLSPGPYKPTSFVEGDSANWPEPAQPYFASTSGFYTLPSGITYATPRGSGTFASQFAGTNPDGNWALYMTEDAPAGSASAANGWCINFTENPVTVAVDLSHQGDGVGTDFVQSETGAHITTVVTAASNTGSTGDPLGTNPLTVTDTFNAALTYTGFSGTGWSCSGSTTVTCTNDSSVTEGNSYPTLTFNVNVSATAPTSIGNSVSVSGAGITNNSGSDTITVDPTPVLAVSKSNTGSFTQGSTGEWDITVSNTAAGSATSGTVTVADTLPSGYTLASYTSSGSLWTCGTIGTGNVSCTATPGITGGSSSAIQLIVNIPASSPTSVSNTAMAWGGGDTTHTNSGNAAISNTSTVSVNQVAASVTVASGNGQSATVETAFGSELVALVKDAGGVTISGTAVTFTVNPAGNGAGATFSNSTGTIAGNTNNGGQAAQPINANQFAGSYTVTAQAGSASTSFSLTNTAGAPASISITGGNNQSAQEGSGFTLPLAVVVADTFGNPVQGDTVTFTPPTSGAGLTFAGGVNTAITDVTGTATSAAITANSTVGSYQVTASAGGQQVPFSLSNTVGALSQFALGTPSTAFTGVPISFTVTAEDSGNNTIPNYTGTVTFSSTDGAATLPIGGSTLTNGTGTFTATLNTPGTQTITATDTLASVSSMSSGILVAAVPNFVVSVATDDAGDASLCNPQASPGSTTDTNCSLRDALLASANAGAGNISFSTSAFSSAKTIPLSNGTLTIPSSTIVTGPTMGSGGSLQNLVTVDGGGAANNSPVFTANSSASNSAIQDLIVTDGYGGGIFNGYAASLTIQNSTISGNNSASGTGGIFNDYNATLTITNSTISGNTGAYGAIVSESGGTVTITESTISGNSATNNGGGGILSGGALTVSNSTISGNSAYSGGGIQISGGTLTLAGSIVAGNTASAFDADINGAATDGGYNIIGDGTGLTGITNGSNGNQVGTTGSPVNPQLAALHNYGGPTQTMIPLPGSVAICASSLSLIPVGVATDQRGDLWQPAGGYCPAGTIDTGSVQSNYGIGFSTQPPATAVGGLAISPSPVVSLSESGSAFTAANTGTVNMTDSASMLGGTTSEGLLSGAASFNNLVITGATSNDILTAMLPLNGAIDVTAQATTGITVTATLATLTPSSGTISASQLFTWNNGKGEVDFDLWVGTIRPGSNNIYDSRETTATSATVSIPSNGVPIYVTLRQLVNGIWQPSYYTFMEPGTPTPATLTPASGTITASQLFTWSNGNGPVDFALWVGTKGPNSNDVYDSLETTATSKTVSIPANGVPIYATLRQLINGTWQITYYTLMEPGTPTPATLTPSTGTLSQSQLFTWNNGAGPVDFALWLGTTGVNSNNLYDSLETTATSTTVSIPPNGVTVYATLRQLINGTWQISRYTFTEPVPATVTMKPSIGKP